ncbi:MAG: DnaA/Hda family protein [Candidatus Nanoarchaeia archaeon]|jgi:hypothetical protein|nr:DnaA/Hda family protein [Candidatus Nanoarchaeia archaeon]|tara:strand:- start:7440 stop:8366 length:927 start_codon:yes stop_codon:yes gene_type:complete
MWHNELNFESNPFSLDKTTELIGYEDVIDEMIYTLESGNMIFIEAPDGFGKTSLLKIAINKYKGEGRVAYIDCNRLDDLNIERVVMNKYGFIKKLISKTPKDMIILIDNINNLSKKNCERLKYFFDQNYIRSVVFSGVDYNSVYFTPSLKDRISKVEKLPELKNEEAIEIIESRVGNNELLSKETIKSIFSISKRNPKQFIKNCEKVAKYAVENYSRIVKQEHITKVFNTKEEIKLESNENKEELIKIKPKKETYKQKVEKELAKEQKKQSKKNQKKSKKEQIPKEIDLEVIENELEKSKQNIAEKYY